MNVGISKIIKRDGAIVKFDSDRILEAIMAAFKAVGSENKEKANELTEFIVEKVNQKFHKHSIPAVEEIQDLVEQALIEKGYGQTAKAYILYRQKRADLREAKLGVLGFIDDSKLSLNGAIIAKEKYLLKDEKGQLAESPSQLFRRVAKYLAIVDKKYDKKAKTQEKENDFYEIMSSLKFIPAGRILANAGTKMNQLSNAFVIPIYDSLEDIFRALSEQAAVHKSGGGTGFDFSKLRPKGDKATVSGGVAAGPVAYLKLFDQASSNIKIGSRHSSNMGVLRVDHPDILQFITAKSRDGVLTNFNISVALTSEFFRCLNGDLAFSLKNPRTGEVVRKIPARQIFDLLITSAWQGGDPGILFMDRINSANPTSHVGKIDSVSACAETPLHPYESSNLGSVNLSNFVKHKEIKWDELKRVVKIAVNLLDNAIDGCDYPLEIIEKTTKQFRRIGLGVMGWADMLYQLMIPYDSDEAVKLAKKVMKFISDAASDASAKLAEERGDFQLYRGSTHYQEKRRRRNATVTAIAPTGSISMLAETSSGIEPSFALCYIKKVLDGRQFLFVNKHLERVARERGFFSESLMRRIAELGSIESFKEIPADVRRVFKVSHQISPKFHVSTQAAFQKYVESAISKTVNFPVSATIKDVESTYMLAYKEGCKGITIYRDQSKNDQVINLAK